MTDGSKYPKTARLQQQREEAYDAEQLRQKIEARREEAIRKVSIAQRGPQQMAESKAAEAAIEKRRKK